MTGRLITKTQFDRELDSSARCRQFCDARTVKSH